MTTRTQPKQRYSLKKFKHDGFSLVVFSDNRLIFASREKNLRPLIKFISAFGNKGTRLTIYDKYVGRAAALLFALVHPKRVYTPIMSRAAIPVMKRYKVKVTAAKTVPHLMGLASRGTCEWEKLSFGRTRHSFFKLVKKQIMG